MSIERGWFYLANLEPRRGTEPGKTRPVLVLQTDLLNEVGHPSTVVIPVTSKIEDESKPLRVRILRGSKGFQIDSDLMIDQVRAIDNRRLYQRGGQKLIKKISRAESGVLQDVEACLKLICDLT